MRTEDFEVGVTDHACERYVERFLRDTMPKRMARRQCAIYARKNIAKLKTALSALLKGARRLQAEGEITYFGAGPIVLLVKREEGDGRPVVMTVYDAKDWRNGLAKRLTGERRMLNKPDLHWEKSA